jgi:hypothetical protein
VRQTLVVLDEHHVYPENDGQPDQRNNAWRSFLGSLLISDQAPLEQSFLPRERITVVLARRDGAGTRTLFIGCVPFFSPEEKKKIAQSEGAMHGLYTFFGNSQSDNVSSDLRLFRIRLIEAMKAALQPAMLTPGSVPRRGGELSKGSLVTSLKQGIPLTEAYGIPRIILFSDMGRFLAGAPQDRAQARAAALAQAQAADLNLKGAELYIAGTAARPGSREALEMFFLASHAELVGISPAASLPSFGPAPVHTTKFQGLIQYPDNRFPVRLRLATDRDGTVVNSWISVQTSQEQFAPFHGVVTCEPNGPCTFTGDDVFAQVWNVKRSGSGEPVFDQRLPFAGARALHFTINGRKLYGNISDTLLHFQGVKNSRLDFSAAKNG